MISKRDKVSIATFSWIILLILGSVNFTGGNEFVPYLFYILLIWSLMTVIGTYLLIKGMDRALYTLFSFFALMFVVLFVISLLFKTGTVEAILLVICSGFCASLAYVKEEEESSTA